MDRYFQGDRIAWLWDNLYAKYGFGKVPDRTKASLSSKFFVTKARIQAHPRSFYTKALQFIYQTPLNVSTYYRGVMLERTWLIIFGEDAYLKDLTIPECDLYDCKRQSQFKDRRLLMHNLARHPSDSSTQSQRTPSWV